MDERNAARTFLETFKTRYTPQSISRALADIGNLKILIIGEAIIDEYQYTSPMGKESKEPLVVHRYIREARFAGGTLATANHLSSLTKHVTLVTLLGTTPSYELFVRRGLQRGLKVKYFHRDGTTIVKRRFIDEYTSQKLFQVSFIPENEIDKKLERTVAAYLKRELPRYDLVMVNDFGHGFLTKKLIHLICRRAKLLSINVQANSANYGFNVITKFPRADIATVDIHEIRLATHDRYSDILPLAKKIHRQLKCKTLVITRGPYGSTSLTKEKGFVDVPAFTDTIVDRMGAGDALFSMVSPALATGMDIKLVLFLGNIAAAIKIGRVGHEKPVSLPEIEAFVRRLLS